MSGRSTAAELAAGVRAGETRRARAGDLARRERRPARRASSSGCSIPRPGARTSSASPGAPGVGKSTLISALVAEVRAAGPHGGRDLGRPDEPVHARRAPRRPDPARRPLPRPGRLHPLDGDARPRGRPRRGDAPGGAAPRRVRKGRRSSSRRSARARTRSGVLSIADTVVLVLHARLGRRGPGAEGRDHGDPRRDRDQQARPSRSPRRRSSRRPADARARRRRAAADRAHRGAPRRGRRRALAVDRRRTRPASRPTASSRSAARATSRPRCIAVASARARRHLENAVQATASSGGSSTRCGAASSTR